MDVVVGVPVVDDDVNADRRDGEVVLCGVVLLVLLVLLLSVLEEVEVEVEVEVEGRAGG
jgi:hypothetical protein